MVQFEERKSHGGLSSVPNRAGAKDVNSADWITVIRSSKCGCIAPPFGGYGDAAIVGRAGNTPCENRYALHAYAVLYVD